jgi:hypothetical protein
MDYLKAAKTSAAPDVGSIDVSKEHYIAALSALHRRGDEMHVNFVEAMRVVGDCFYHSSGYTRSPHSTVRGRHVCIERKQHARGLLATVSMGFPGHIPCSG